MDETVKVTREGRIALVLLNRPHAFNAFDLDTVQALSRELMALSGDGGVRAIVITGEGKAFCAGGDLKWAASFGSEPASAFHRLAGHLHLGILEIRRMRKPVIAAVNGVAAGAGFSLALACDFRVLGRSATLRQAYTSNGLCINGGGTFSLPRLVGLARALEVAAFDEAIPAQKALAWGLATKVVDDTRVVEEAMAMGRELARRSLSSFGWSKQLLIDAFDTSLEAQLERERAGLVSCAAHRDGQEGLRAFVEKRKPIFDAR